ncbi:MAG TPA: 16S rRNA (cytosine(1402)-N(4))-methyltransferase RsmH, partial [Candidatus Paceibacterota bacterium]
FGEQALADIFFGYGEERYAKRIAKRVIERREIAPFNTTFELVEAVKDAVPPAYRHGRLHPATRTFQALRIAVNDELGALTAGLTQAWEILAPGGRIAVISFHSTEDRVVKQLFKSFGGELVFKKPLTASREEISSNPASRSAKLRTTKKN